MTRRLLTCLITFVDSLPRPLCPSLLLQTKKSPTSKMAMCGCALVIVLATTTVMCCYVLLRFIVLSTTREAPDPCPPTLPTHPEPYLPHDLSPTVRRHDRGRCNRG